MLALAASGCSSLEGVLGTSQPSSPPPAADSSGGSSFTQRVKSLFSSGSGTPAGEQKKASETGPNPDVDCPGIDIREGASTLAVNAPGADPNATNVRYQATIAQTARECAIAGPTMTIKVGIQGRIILGPAGSPGPVEVPMRLALVREGIEPRTIWTKLYRVPVTVPPGEGNVPFVQVEENMSFPVPKRSELEAYVVYVGFDSSALVTMPERKHKKR
ncbi:MAG TPA: hypothetical protein VEK73_08580 [Xanthobacteraceae bacterium]|nr:hypothetical protein [Xanthobacteraceae bacterium]